MLMFTYKLSLNISSSLWCYRLENASVLISVSVYNCSHRHNNNLNTSSCRWKSLCAMSPCAPHTEFIWGSTLYCHYSYSVMLYVFFFPRLPAFYPEAAYMLCECALHKTNRDETIRERGCFTVSFRHILDLMFIRILTTSLFDRRQRMCGGQRWIH